ncbi:hypothetical protein BKA69DRAFT_1134133 [Paraphysoderma sedebokerense]|nr:hypothetical protein BKA69DRAFT_1134133 [Paraphysoderma sedebokerense]
METVVNKRCCTKWSHPKYESREKYMIRGSIKLLSKKSLFNILSIPTAKSLIAARPIRFASERTHAKRFSTPYKYSTLSRMTHPSLLDETLESFAKLAIVDGNLSNDGKPFPADKVPSIQGSDPTNNPLDIFRNILAINIVGLIKEISPESAANITPEFIYAAIEAPKDPAMGDLAVPVPRLRLKGKPVDLAKQIAEKFNPNSYIIASSAAGPFLNFRISHPVLRYITLSTIFSSPATYGSNTSGSGKTAIVEFSSPNIAKPFHAGHLRSTIIGSFIRNVLIQNGWKVVAMNYLGDWGKQYGLLAVGFEKFGSEEELLKDPIKHLYEIYVKINKEAEADSTIHDQARAYFKKMEDGEPHALSVWKRFRELSIAKYIETYARLNISFDVYSGESQVPSAEMESALTILKDNGILTLDDGAQIIDLTKYDKKLGKCVVQKKDGTSLYLTRDIGAAKTRFDEYNFDKMIYVVASQQDLHFKQLFKIMQLSNYSWSSKLEHINFGLVSGMSTRKGTVVFLEEILNNTKEEMMNVMKKNEEKFNQIENPDEVADLVAISAIVVQDMSARRVKDYAFNWSRMLSFEGDTGPYLQYAHARLSSILRNAGVDNTSSPFDTSVPFSSFKLSLLPPEAKELVNVLSQYPDLISSVPKTNYEPCNVVTYLFKLCHAVSAAYEIIRVKGVEDEEVKKVRVLLYWCVKNVLSSGLKLIGLKPLDRM